MNPFGPTWRKHTSCAQTLVPVGGSQGQSLQVEVQPLVLGRLQRPGAGAVLGGIWPVMGGRGQDPPHGGVLHRPPTESCRGQRLSV